MRGAAGNQGTIDRVEVKVLEGGERCKTKEEILDYSYSYDYDLDSGILTFSSLEEEGTRYIREAGDDQLFVKNNNMVGRWIMNGDDELHIGEFVTSRFSLNRTETVLGALEPCEIEFDYNRLESYVNFYATDHMEIFYTMRLDNGDHCLSTDLGTIIGNYEFRPEENQFSIYFPVGNQGSWGEQIYNYESINHDKFYFLFRSAGTTTSPDDVEP